MEPAPTPPKKPQIQETVQKYWRPVTGGIALLVLGGFIGSSITHHRMQRPPRFAQQPGIQRQGRPMGPSMMDKQARGRRQSMQRAIPQATPSSQPVQ